MRVRLIGLLVTLGIIGGLVWYLLGDTGREAAQDAVTEQVDEAHRMVRGVEKTVSGAPMERLQKEDRDEMRRVVEERTSGR